MKDKKIARLRRATRSRAKIRELGVYRLSIHRTPKHIYAQVIAPNGSDVVAAASTLQAELKGGLKSETLWPQYLNLSQQFLGHSSRYFPIKHARRI